MGYVYKGWMWNLLVMGWVGQEWTKCQTTFQCYVLGRVNRLKESISALCK